MPARLLSLTALALTVAALAAPAATLAQSDPFGPIPQPAPQPTPTVAPAGDDEDDGLNRTQEILIGLAGLALLVGIGWAIVRDARTAAPGHDRRRGSGVTDLPGHDEERPRGSRPPKHQRVRQNRSKAKAARQARKRNR